METNFIATTEAKNIFYQKHQVFFDAEIKFIESFDKEDVFSILFYENIPKKWPDGYSKAKKIVFRGRIIKHEKYDELIECILDYLEASKV